MKMAFSIKSLYSKTGRNGKVVIKNSLFSMAGSVLGQLIAMLSSIAMGRMTGVNGVGAYTFGITLSGIIYLFLNLGFSGIFQRNISRDISVAEKHYANALSLRFFFSLPMGVALSGIIGFAIGERSQLQLYFLCGIYTAITGIFGLVGEGFSAIERFDINFWFGMAQKLFGFIGTFFSLYFFRNITVMVLVNDIVIVFLIICELVCVNRIICKVRLELDLNFAFQLVREAFPTIFGAAAEYLSLKSDSLVLAVLLGTSATGIYAISSNIYIAASFIPLSLAKAATPTFNRMLSKGEKVKNLVKKIFLLMTVSSIVLIIGIFFVGRWGVISLWGVEFESAIQSLRILSLSLLFMPANRFLEYLLVGLRKQIVVARCCVIGTALNIGANIIFVPMIGMNTVAVTTVITEMLVMIMEGVYCKAVFKKMNK